jgi:hypothetical protein
MPPKNEKEAWLHIIKPDELDTHLANIGQAAANATIVKELFKKHPLAEGSRLLIHGCGTCQMFDYIKPSDIGKVDMSFADINDGMLEVAERRLRKYKEASCHFLADDIENTNIGEHYDALLLILVLLHVDWRRSLENMIKLTPSLFYIIEQEQEAGTPSIAKERKLPPSIKEYAEVEATELISLRELTKFFNERGYHLTYSIRKAVPDKKFMVGLIYANY